MPAAIAKCVALIVFGAAIALAPEAALSQSSGGSGGGSSAGGSAGGSVGGNSGPGRAGPSDVGPRTQGGELAKNPGGLRSQAAPSATPGLTTPAQESTRRRAMELRDSAVPLPVPVGPGDDRGRTSDVGRGPGTERSEPNELAGGGRARHGAVGRTMAECEAAWDADTHMSKETWRDTCRRTLTAPHL
jgi:hypothetical protein